MARVLVVEDDPACRVLLERELGEAGHVVQAAGDALEAELLARAFVPQVIVADVRLPNGVDGLELCRRLIEEPPHPEVILITAFGSVQTAIDGIRLGAFDFLLKPFGDLEQLRGSVARAARRVEERCAQSGAARSATALLDELSLAMVLVDEGGRVQGHNRAAESILSAGDGLRIAADGTLRCLRTEEQEALSRAVAACCSERCSRAAPLRVSRCPGRPALRVLVVPVPGHPEAGRSPRPRLAALVASVPEARPPLGDGTILARLYGLTPAEGAMLARLVAGASVREACQAIGISLATGRTHLGRVLSKTGTHRQSELVALVVSGPGVLAGGTTGTSPPPSGRGGGA